MADMDFLRLDMDQWSHWFQSAPWLALLAGILAGMLVFIVASLLTGRRPQVAAPPRCVLESASLAITTGDLDPFVKGGKKERRAALRRRGNSIGIQILEDETNRYPRPAWVIDRSSHGLCLAASKAYAEGTTFLVRTTNAPDTTPWVQVAVKNCRQSGKDWELGCQFTQSPPWSILLLFG